MPSTLRRTASLFVALALGFGYPAAQSASTANDVALTNITVIDVERGSLIPAQTVLAQNGRITAMAPASDVRVPAGAQVIDGTAKYVIPGLWDMYADALFDQAPSNVFPLLIAHGVTGFRSTNRSMSDSSLAQLRAQIAAGEVTAPRIVDAGQMIVYEHGPMSRPAASRIVVKDAHEAVKAVDSLKRAGVDYIDVLLLPADILTAVIERARAHGLRVAAKGLTWKETSEAGVYSLEHTTELSRGSSIYRHEFIELMTRTGRFLHLRGQPVPPEVTDTLYRRLRANRDTAYFRDMLSTLTRNNTWVITSFANMNWARAARELPDTARRKFRTPAEQSRLEKGLSAEYPPPLIEGNLRDVGDAHRAGVKLVAGTQSTHPQTSTPGATLHDELYWLTRAGLTPLEALRAATLHAALYLGKGDSLGTIARGKSADLVVLDANPLEDIGNTRRIAAVVLNGRVFDRVGLDRLLKLAEEDAKRRETVNRF